MFAVGKQAWLAQICDLLALGDLGVPSATLRTGDYGVLTTTTSHAYSHLYHIPVRSARQLQQKFQGCGAL